MTQVHKGGGAVAAAVRDDEDQRRLLHAGTTIPALPLALTDDGVFDARHQRAIIRYQLAAGVGGLAVGVHSTEFAIRDPQVGLFRPVLELAAETVHREATTKDTVLVAGACGPTRQAVAEAELAAELGYHAVLLSPGGIGDVTEAELIERTRAVAEVLPVIGFYLQPAVGGRLLSQRYWHDLAAIDGVVAIKAAPFDRYATLDVLRAVAASGREDLVVYTGNDDSIIHDLITPFEYPSLDAVHTTWMRGGLLGHWAVWARRVVEMFERVQRVQAGDATELPDLLRLAPQVTDANSAIFDPAHGFRGCIPGIKEVLRRQGLLASVRCLDPDERLSEGQAAQIDRVTAAYPWLTDDEFVAEHLDAWLS